MPFSRIRNAIAPTLRAAKAAADGQRKLQSLYTPAQMQGMLRRERARCDRQKGVFSILLLRLVDVKDNRSLNRLARHVLKLVRETDELGYIDQETLCVVLPDTDANGASLFTRRVIRAVRREKHKPSSVIYTYPDPSDDQPTPPQSGSGHSDRRIYNSHGVSDVNSIGSGSNYGKDRTPATNNSVPTSAASLQSRFDLHLHDRRNDSGSLDVPILPMHTMFALPVPWWKRLLDISVSVTVITLAIPLFVLIALIIKIFDPGPVIFKQVRTGLGGRAFGMFKFRTMVVNAEKLQPQLRAHSEQDGPAFKLKKDPRITRVGGFLRKTSLDELPQLFNILRGDMTLVGPRPLPVKEAAQCRGWQRHRHDVTPGLTCIWQVEGRSRVKFDDWMRMDMNYARTRHPISDLMILFKTVPAVLFRRGAS